MLVRSSAHLHQNRTAGEGSDYDGDGHAMVCWKLTSAVIGAILLICVASAASAGTPDSAGAPSPNRHSADVILTNGHILTEDSHGSVVEALAIRDGRLIALGTNAQILPLADRATRVIDLHGRTATPGLID